MLILDTDFVEAAAASADAAELRTAAVEESDAEYAFACTGPGREIRTTARVRESTDAITAETQKPGVNENVRCARRKTIVEQWSEAGANGEQNCADWIQWIQCHRHDGKNGFSKGTTII